MFGRQWGEFECHYFNWKGPGSKWNLCILFPGKKYAELHPKEDKKEKKGKEKAAKEEKPKQEKPKQEKAKKAEPAEEDDAPKVVKEKQQQAHLADPSLMKKKKL